MLWLSIDNGIPKAGDVTSTKRIALLWDPRFIGWLSGTSKIPWRPCGRARDSIENASLATNEVLRALYASRYNSQRLLCEQQAVLQAAWGERNDPTL